MLQKITFFAFCQILQMRLLLQYIAFSTKKENIFSFMLSLLVFISENSLGILRKFCDQQYYFNEIQNIEIIQSKLRVSQIFYFLKCCFAATLLNG